MNDTQKVKVTYGDGKGNHETTVSELRKKFVQENEYWRDRFFGDLEKGVAYSAFAQYELIKTPLL